VVVGLTVGGQSLMSWNDWTSYVACAAVAALWAVFRA
jgi:hypothetical protein